MIDTACARCTAVVERATQAERARDAALVDLENAEADLRSLRRRERWLERELGRANAPDSGEWVVIRRLFAYWQDACRRPRSKLTDDRVQAIRARLRDGYGEARIRQAIDGAARAAFVDARGKRHDDIALICRGGEKLEAFEERAALPPLSSAVAARNGTRANGRPDPFERPLDRFLEALRRSEQDYRPAEEGQWNATCPAHPDRSPSLRVKECPDGKVAWHCHAGCKPFDVLSRLGLGWGDVYPDGKGG